MKQDITCYMNSLTKSNMDLLEQILSLQYRKFMKFYRIVESYSSDIEDLQYEYEEAKTLNVSLVLNNKKDAKELKEELEQSMLEHDCSGTVEVKKKDVFITIQMEEKD